MASLRLNKINKKFTDTHVLHDIDLEITNGEFVVLVGPSGCGKSTMLRLIAGLEQASSGEIFLAGEEISHVPAAERGLAMVFQSYALYPHMSVYQNMAFALENAKLAKTVIDQTVRKAAAMLRLDDLLRRKPTQLSGGQRQRVAIGRAMVRNPKIFLFDEPLSNLDAELRVAMRKELAALHDEIATTMIYVTHDQVEAMTMADRIVVMNAGVIEQVGTPLDVYNHPRNKFVAGFIGSPRMNFLDAKVSAAAIQLTNGTSLSTTPPASLTKDQEIIVGIRPEHIVIAPDESHPANLECSVEINEQLGGESYIYCSSPSTGQLTVHSPGQNSLRRGDKVRLYLPPDSIHLFDKTDNVVTN